MSTDSVTTAEGKRSVSFVFSEATLLSGGIDDCESVDDESCRGGVALVHAYLRQYSDGIDDANLVVNRIDFQSTFVQMHPLNWSVNRLILNNRFGMENFFANPSFLEQDRQDSDISQRDLSGLRSNSFVPFLHGNVVVGTTNSWSQYAKNILFHKETGLAIIPIQGQFISTGDITSLPPLDTASALINHVVQENRISGCLESTTPYDAYLATLNTTSSTTATTAGQDSDPTCYVPMLLKIGGGFFEPFLQGVMKFANLPAVLVDVNGDEDVYREPTLIEKDGRSLWVVNFPNDARTMQQIRLSFEPTTTSTNDKTPVVGNLTKLSHTLRSFPNATKDAQLEEDVIYLRKLADEAKANNPIKGLSGPMPIARVDSLRACFGGECPIGNLFTDALRWYTGADFSFIQSGGIRGVGWPEGPVRVSNIWNALPFANTECTGFISGVTVFKLFELSTRLAQYVSHRVESGDRLFQVSGLRYTYNTQVEASRLMDIQILNKETGLYEPVERLKLYKFATSSWMCSGFDPFPAMLSEELVIDGEVPSTIGDQILQNIVGEYLEFAHGTEPFDTTIQGRLTNDTLAIRPLDLVETTDSCTSTTYWVEGLQSCIACPSTARVALSSEEDSFQGVSGVDAPSAGTVRVSNGEDFPIRIALKSKPGWATVLNEEIFEENAGPKLVSVPPGDGISVGYEVSTVELPAGVATGVLSFAVLDAGNFPGCVGSDVVYRLTQNVSETPEFVQAGAVRIVGFSMVGIVWLVTTAFAFWVYTRREKKAVKMMQPAFLMAICLGVFVISLSILPQSMLGWDKVSERGQDMACMANAWLLSMGFCLVMSALLAKLWRINKVVDGARAFRRTNISVKQAAINFSIQFVLNFVLMLVWTLVDPMQYEVQLAENQTTEFGTCTNMGAAGWTFLSLTVGINFCVLLLAVYEAYKARNLGEEYSESAGVGLALFSWLQLVMVVVPVLFLIEEDNVKPRYFLNVSLVFACCMSMLLFIFVPIMRKVYFDDNPDVVESLRGTMGKYRFASSAKLLFTSGRWGGTAKPRNSAPSTALRKDPSGPFDPETIQANPRRIVSMQPRVPTTLAEVSTDAEHEKKSELESSQSHSNGEHGEEIRL